MSANMKPVTVRSQAEIDELLNICAERGEAGATNYPGMTYEQGIVEAINWLLEWHAGHPLGGEE